MKGNLFILGLILLNSIFLLNSSYAQEKAELEWAKQLGGNKDVWGEAICTDTKGYVYTIGEFFGTADFDPSENNYLLTSNGYSDIYISKLDSFGNYVWAKQFGGSGFNLGFSICVDSFGNVFTTGEFEGTVDFNPDETIYNLSSSNGSTFISKLNSDGNFLWAKQLTIEPIDGKSICVDSKGNLLIIGKQSGSVVVEKFNAEGNNVWLQQFGGENGSVYARSISTDKNNNIYITGVFSRTIDFDPSDKVFNLKSKGFLDIYVLKLDSTGNFNWVKQISGGYGSDVANIYDLSINDLNEIYFVGDIQGTFDFDPSESTHKLNSDSGSIFISKFTSSGEFIWAKQFGGNGSTKYDKSVSVDKLGNAYLMAAFHGTDVDFDPGEKEYKLTALFIYNTFISKFSSSGEFKWVKQFGEGFSYVRSDISVDVSGNIYSMGNFGGKADFDLDADTFYLNGYGKLDAFILKMSQNDKVTTIENPININNYIIYPNPTKGIITITLDNVSDTEINVFNEKGQRIKTVFNQNQIDLSDNRNGLYIITFKTKKQLFNFQVLKVD